MPSKTFIVATVVLIGCTTMSGCLQDSDQESFGPEETPQGPEWRNEFSWYGHNITGDAAVKISLFVPTFGECSFEVGAGGRGENGGTYALRYGEFDNGGWSAGRFGQREEAHAHSEGLLDTREAIPHEPEDYDGLLRTTYFKFRGNVTLVLAGTNVAPTASIITKGAALLINLTCQQPFQITGMWASRQVLIVTDSTMSGGTGAHADLLAARASFAHQNKASAVHDSPTVEFRSYHSDDQGQLFLRHPDGEESWNLESATQRYVTFRGRSGAYEVELNRVGVGIPDAGRLERFDACLISFHEVKNLDEVRLLPTL